MTHQEYLRQIDSVIENGKYKADWASLSGHKTPDWYYKGKLGIFIHWGIYSVPAYKGEWYSRRMYDRNAPEFEYHIKNFGPHKDFGYKDFIPMFTGKNFDADRWVSIFKDAGAKFVMPVCEHHDGFAMYDTEFNRWNAKNMGPCRDVAGEIKAACERQGLSFCSSTHRAEHYFFMNMGRTCDSDVNDDTFRDFYGPAFYCPELDGDTMCKTTEDVFTVGASEEWLEDWLVRTCELVDRYRPRSLYFDWWIQNCTFKPYLKKLCAYYYNRAEEWGEEVTINYKHNAFPPTVATFDIERGGLKDIFPSPWQTDTAIGKYSWGYTEDNEFKSSGQIITDLIDTVSKNGMLLVNVGPKPDGTFTEAETKVLKDLGAWMKLNGEGIYDTTVWKTFGEGSVNSDGGYFNEAEKAYTPEDYRFTYKNGSVYAFRMRSAGSDALIKSMARTGHHDFIIDDVELLSTGEKLGFERNENGLLIKANDRFDTEFPTCFRIKLG